MEYKVRKFQNPSGTLQYFANLNAEAREKYNSPEERMRRATGMQKEQEEHNTPELKTTDGGLVMADYVDDTKFDSPIILGAADSVDRMATRGLNYSRTWGLGGIGDVINTISPKAADWVTDNTWGLIPHTTEEDFARHHRSNPNRWDNIENDSGRALESVAIGAVLGAGLSKVGGFLNRGIKNFRFAPQNLVPRNTPTGTVYAPENWAQRAVSSFGKQPTIRNATSNFTTSSALPNGTTLPANLRLSSGPMQTARLGLPNGLAIPLRIAQGALAKTNQVVGRPVHSDMAAIEALKNTSMDDLLAMMGRSNSMIYPQAQNLEELQKHPGNSGVNTIYDSPKKFLSDWMNDPITKQKLATNLAYKHNENYAKMSSRPGVDASTVTPTSFYHPMQYRGYASDAIDTANKQMNNGLYFGTLERTSPDWKDFQKQFSRIAGISKDNQVRYFSDDSVVNGFQSNYRSGQKSVTVQNPKGLKNSQSTATHEITHMSGMDKVMGDILPQSDWEPLLNDIMKTHNSYSPNMSPEDLQTHKTKTQEYFTGINSEGYNYLNNDVEKYPRLMELRYNSKLKPGEYIDDAKMKQIRSESPDNSIWSMFSPKTIKFMLNFFASNNTKDTVGQRDIQDINYA